MNDQVCVPTALTIPVAKSHGVPGVFWACFIILLVVVVVSTLIGTMTGVQAIGTGLLMVIAYYVRRVAHAAERLGRQ